jgi:protein phosphatase
MIVVFGGRGIDQSALNDTWGLRKHRDGKWDWVQAPYKTNVSQPEGRYQHSAIFMNSCMIIIGGRTNNANEMLPMEIYDTENSEW